VSIRVTQPRSAARDGAPVRRAKVVVAMVAMVAMVAVVAVGGW